MSNRKIKLPIQQEITTDVIDYVLKQHSKEANRINKLKSYYDNHNDILKRVVKDHTKPNNKLSHPYCAFITDMAVGHFLGVPVAYKSDNEELINRLTEINDYNDEADNNSSLAMWQSIAGYGIDLIYVDEEAMPRFKSVNPATVAVVYDDTISENIQFAIRYFDIPQLGEEEKQVQVEVYTKNNIITYLKENDKYTFVKEEYHYFNDAPISVFANNDDMVGDFEKTMSLIDAYDKLESFTVDEFEYFNDAYLMVTGATLDEETAQALKEMRVINLPDSDSKAEFLIKAINDTELENLKNRLKEDIHKFSFIPDITSEGFTSSISGEALKFKFSALNNICKTKQNKFKKGLLRRIEIICNFLSIKNRTEYTDIIPVFTLNMPKNEMDLASMVKNLYGLVSHETLLAQLPMVDDVRYELEKLEEENSNLIDDYSGLNLGKEDDVNE